MGKQLPYVAIGIINFLVLAATVGLGFFAYSLVLFRKSIAVTK